MVPFARPTASNPYVDGELVEAAFGLEFGGAKGENATAVISEGVQSTNRHLWTYKFVRSASALLSIRGARRPADFLGRK